MNIHEYQAKQLFTLFAIPVSKGRLAVTSDIAMDIARELGGNGWVVKAQIHAGGRGKVGGVKVARTIEEVADYSNGLLGKRIVTIQTDNDGLPINSLLIERLYDIKHEYYLSILIDRSTEKVIFIASLAGGVDIETVANKSPEMINKVTIDSATGLQAYQCRKIAYGLGMKGLKIKVYIWITNNVTNNVNK